MTTSNNDLDRDGPDNHTGEKRALLRLLVWAYNRLEELESLETAEHVASAIATLKNEP